MDKHPKAIILLIILIFFTREEINGQVNNTNETHTRFDQVHEFYPKNSIISEARYWSMAHKNNFQDHPCKRKCVANQQMTCYYKMVVHYDATMGPKCQQYLNRLKIENREYIDIFAKQSDCKYADGKRKKLIVVNGQFPGPSIETCIGDAIIADIINMLKESTTIHWHGIHQLNTPYMDGAPYVTQNPIEPGQKFRYSFNADHAGTHWWHSHTNHQRAFGFAGKLIVRQTRKENVHANLYDFDYMEHVIMIQDYMTAFNKMEAKGIIINGLGSNKDIIDSAKPIIYSKFTVSRGGRYRFRVISNTIINCPISLSIDQHDLLIISSDGNDINPILVQKLMIHGGERFDFILNTNQPIKNYWIRIKGYALCQTDKLHQEAILNYKGAHSLSIPKGDMPTYSNDPANAAEFNGFDVSPSTNSKRYGFNDVKSIKAGGQHKPDHTLYASMNIVTKNNISRFLLDDITFSRPKVTMLQNRNFGIGNSFCNRTQKLGLGYDCSKTDCKCTNVLQVPAFKHIEIVIFGKSDTAHPIHLHGYSFRVVGMGVLGEDKIDKIEEIDSTTPLPRRLFKAPLKDTIQVPAHGYTIIRFYTNNPGYWLFHCHISTHAEDGMTAVLRVGEDIQMKSCPFGNCG